MLTHPDGGLMVEKAMEITNNNEFDRIIIVILQEHVDQYEAKIWLDQVFKNKVEVCILDCATKSQSETVYAAILKMNVAGSFCVKDSDSYLTVKLDKGNFVTGVDVRKFPSISNISGKSFISLNEQLVITEIVEKSVSSNYISVGLYGFNSTEEYIESYLMLSESTSEELYLSYIISSMISERKVFNYIEAIDYVDWGTEAEWKKDINKIRCCFVDIDGVVFENKGKYGSKNWGTKDVPLRKNIDALKNIQKSGGQIIFCTARSEEYRKKTENSLTKEGLIWHSIVMGCLHSKRYIINDYAPTNKYPSCTAINIARNSDDLYVFL